MVFDRIFAFLTKFWVIALFVLVILGCYFYIDKQLASFLFPINYRANVRWLTWLTSLGTGALYIVGFLLAALFFRYVKPKPVWEARAWFLWLCIVLCSTITAVLKVLLGRARPDLWFEAKLYGFYGWQMMQRPFMSFPSGHTTTMMSVALGLSIIFPRHWLLFMATGFLVALSRVLLLQHYLSDVLTATYLVIIEIGLLRLVLRKKGWLGKAWPAKKSYQEDRIMQASRHYG